MYVRNLAKFKKNSSLDSEEFHSFFFQTPFRKALERWKPLRRDANESWSKSYGVTKERFCRDLRTDALITVNRAPWTGHYYYSNPHLHCH